MPYVVSPATSLAPFTGVLVPITTVLVTQDGQWLVPQVTGEPPGGLNTLPGTFTPLPAGQSVGLPYGFSAIPSTGPLT